MKKQMLAALLMMLGSVAVSGCASLHASSDHARIEGNQVVVSQETSGNGNVVSFLYERRAPETPAKDDSSREALQKLVSLVPAASAPCLTDCTLESHRKQGIAAVPILVE